MKKLISFILVSMLLSALVFVLPVSAEDTWTEETMLWVTHYNSASEEGAGVIVTDQAYNTSHSWRINVVFEPVEGKTDVYEITAVYDYLGSFANPGAANQNIDENIVVPEGGFVYQINIGNDYPSLGAGYEGKPDYTSESCSNAATTAQGWAIGDQFMFSNVDLEGFVVSTSTPDLLWYEDGYVCTATFKTLVQSSVLPTESDPVEDDSAPATDDKSEAPAESAPAAEESKTEEKSGCGSSIAATAVVITSVFGLAVGFTRRKK